MDTEKNTAASSQAARPNLIEIIDRLTHIRNLTEAGYMAAADVGDRAATGALQAVSVTALNAIDSLTDLVEAMRQPEQAGA